MITIYGINNCSTVKKAINFFENHGVAAVLYDYKKSPVTNELLERIYQQFGENILNKKSTTWRSLDNAKKQVLDKLQLFDLLKEYPSLIKRPILIHKEIAILGYNENDYLKLL